MKIPLSHANRSDEQISLHGLMQISGTVAMATEADGAQLHLSISVDSRESLESLKRQCCRWCNTSSCSRPPFFLSDTHSQDLLVSVSVTSCESGIALLLLNDTLLSCLHLDSSQKKFSQDSVRKRKEAYINTCACHESSCSYIRTVSQHNLSLLQAFIFLSW